MLSEYELLRARWATRGQFLGLGVLAGFWGVHIPSVKTTYSLSETALSLVLLAVSAGAVLALLGAAKFVNALGVSRAVPVVAVPMGGLLASALYWDSTAALLVAMLLMGGLMSLFDVAINTEGSAIEASGRERIMGNLHGCFSVGGMLGALVAGLWIKAGLSATHQLGIAGGLVALFALLTGRWMSVSSRGPVEPFSAPGRPVGWPPREVWVLGCLAFVGMGAEGAIYDWSVLYLSTEKSMEPAHAAWGYAVFAGTMAATRFRGDAMRTHFGEAGILRAGGWVTAAAMATLLAAGHDLLAFFALGCIGGGLAMVVPILYNTASKVAGSNQASGIATVSAMGYCGFLVGPPVIGLVSEWLSLSWALSTIVVLGCVLAWGSRQVKPGP